MTKTDSYLIFTLLAEGDKTEEEIFKKVKKMGFPLGESEKGNIRLELRYHKTLEEVEIKKNKYHLIVPIDTFSIKSGIRNYLIDRAFDNSQPIKNLKTKLENYI